MHWLRSFAPSLAIAALLLVSAGCERRPAAQSAPAPRERPTTQPSPAPSPEDLDNTSAFLRQSVQADTSGLPTGHPPLDAGGAQPAEPALPSGHPPFSDRAAARETLHYEAPTTWNPKPTTSSMRKAQYVLPDPAGESADGELVVYYFGPRQGGSVTGNIARWRGMFVTESGEPIGDDAVRQETFDIDGLAVTVLDATGTYLAGTDPGAPHGAAQRAEYRLLAAIVETPGGPWFFKALGPAATMEAQQENFMAFVRSVEYGEHEE